MENLSFRLIETPFPVISSPTQHDCIENIESGKVEVPQGTAFEVVPIKLQCPQAEKVMQENVKGNWL